jgi:tetrapyrrole methylase family protein / MazG family protein
MPRMTRTFADLVALMTRLRGPGGCPWDCEQTMLSLKPFVIEEAYEVVDAIDRNDREALREELGDLLLEAIFLAEIAREEGSFTIDDSITAVHEKLVRRHPHVFGDVDVETADEVLVNWEKLKSAERREENKGILSGVPPSLPALLKATRMTEKAARVGFDWETTDDVFDKLHEELGEFEEAMKNGDRAHAEAEMGDLLFTIANIARRLSIPAEEALQATNRKFQRRFEYLERSIHDSGRTFDDTILAELDALWNEAKGIVG